MLDSREHMKPADISVSLLPPVTELNGWKRAIKVAVTCRCMEVSATSALPAVSEATGACYNREWNHYYFSSFYW